MLWNLPNILTAMRIVLIPFFIGFALMPGREGLLLSTFFFGLAAFTDWADGYIARKKGLYSDFGRFFDPVADKLMVISALLLLLSLDRAPFYLVLIIMAREVIIMALRERMSGLGKVLHVSWVGKWKTGFQMAAITMLFLQDGLTSFSFQIPGVIFLHMATILAVWSGYLYFSGAWPKLQGNGAAPS